MPKSSAPSICILITLGLWVVIAIAGCAPAQPTPTPVPSHTPAPSPTATLVFLPQVGGDRPTRGVNMGNALEAPREGEWGMVLEEAYFAEVAEAGFDSVRIPIRWSSHAMKAAPFALDERFAQRVDWAIEQCLSRDLLAVINIHHYEEMASEPAKHKARYLAIWQQIAERYADYDQRLVFELLNEPNGSLGPALWNEIAAEALAVVRQSNPTRDVIIGPGHWNNVRYLGGLKLPDDPYLIVTFHYYDPFHFTHQGAEWVDGSTAWMGTRWDGTEAQRKAIVADLDMAARVAEQRGWRLYMGEFGAYDKADMDSRVRWTTFLTREAEKRGISWAYWEFGAGFGAYDRSVGQWRQELLDALIPPEP